MVELIEKNIVDAIERVTADFEKYLGIPMAESHKVFQPYYRPFAEAFADSLAAGESAEQLEARIAALKIKESS